MIVDSLLYGIILPILTSVLVFGLFLFLLLRQDTVTTTESSSVHPMAWAGALALGASYAVGNIGLLGWPTFPAIEASQWLFWFLPAALLLALLDSVWRIPRAALWVGRTVMLGGMLWMMFRSQVENEVWTSNKLVFYVAMMTTVGLMLWAVWEQIAKQFSDTHLGWLMMIFSIATSMSLALSNTAKLAQLCGVMVSGLGVWWVLSWLSQVKGTTSSFARGILPVYILLFVGLGFTGYFYADLSNMTAGLLATSVVLLWLVPKWVKPQKNWQQLLLYSIIVLTPVGIALATLAIKEMQKPKNPYQGMLSIIGLG